jgi:TRAP-type transport system periplasmic protein
MLTRRLAGAALLAAAVGVRQRQPLAAETAWRIVTEYPATAIPGEGISFFAETATQLSGGALTIQPGFDAPGGLKSAGMLSAVHDGRVEAADAFTGALAGEAAIFQLSALPFLTSSAADTQRLLTVARSAYVAALNQFGVSLLYATPWPATGLWSRLPVAGAESLRGLRVRTYDAASTAVLLAAGAAPVQITFADAVSRLRTDQLDAVLSSGDGGAGARLWELLPNFTELDYASPLSLAFCNSATLAATPRPVRDAVMQAGLATEARQFQAIATRRTDNDARMRANGVRVASAPQLRAALMAASAKVIADWTDRTGAEGEKILAAYRAP